MSLPGGVPPTSAEERDLEQRTALRSVVTDAIRMLPTAPNIVQGQGQGHGDGPPPHAVEAIANGILTLHSLTGSKAPVLDWLTTMLDQAPSGDPGDRTVAALAVRDLLLAAVDSGEPAWSDSEDDAEAERTSAERFATITVEVET